MPGGHEGARPVAVRLYGWALRALPPAIHREDGAEMARVFAELWATARGRSARARLLARAFAHLPGVVLAEWFDALGRTETRSRGGWEMTGWTRHLRFAVRTLRKAPAFTTTSVLLIALGVGAVTTIFTLVDHVLLRPLPYPAAERLLAITNGSHSGLLFRELERLDGVEAWAAGWSDDANLTGHGDPIRIEQSRVSEGFFSLLGAHPARGRLLVEDDFEAADAVVLSNATWRSMLGGDPDVVGQTLVVDGEPVVVVGVLDEAFEPPRHVVSAETALYRPVDWSSETILDPGYHIMEIVGRLRPGVSLADFQGRLDTLADAYGRANPDATDGDGNPVPLPAVGLQDATVQRVRTGLSLLFGAVGLLLLVACLNVAHLFLARGMGRVQEMAVRRALGAGSSGLAQQLLVESLVVGTIGGVVGLVLARTALSAVLAMNPPTLPRSSALGMDLRVAGFAALLSVATAVLFGLLPALRTVGRDLAGDLRGESRGATGGKGTQRLRAVLVVTEVAVSLVLVAQAGLLLRSFMAVQGRDRGFDVEGVWTIPLTPTEPETPEEYVAAMNDVLASLESVPGVESAEYGLTQPFQYVGGRRCCWRRGLAIDESEDADVTALIHPVSLRYFETLRIPLRAGSTWTTATEDERPVPAIVTERLAIDTFGSADAALGHVLGSAEQIQFRIVGVATDVGHYGLDQPDPVALYAPMSVIPFQIPIAHMAVRVGTPEPAGLARTLREAVWRAAPTLPVPTVRPMQEWIDDSVSGRRFDSAVVGAFGFIALLLAAAGLYGTLLYHVRQRRRELGIRLALGAARGTVEREVAGRGIRLTALGCALGVLVSMWAGGLLEARLFDVERTDPMALGGAVLALMCAATLASWLPARRAGRTDPLQTLKAE